MHPGIIDTEGLAPALKPFAKDKGELTDGIKLYLAQSRAVCLRCCFFSVDCDAEELERHQAEFRKKKLGKLGILNRPLQPGGYDWRGEGWV